MFPWQSVISVNRDSTKPIYLQIVNSFIKEITQGRLNAGHKLPGTRALAEQLQLNRKTVADAYDELLAQGWINIIPSKGTFVSSDLPLERYKSLSQKTVKAMPVHQTGFSVNINDNISAETPDRGSLIEVNDGSPDVRLAPIDILMKNYRSIATGRLRRQYLAYSGLTGDPYLRQVLSNYLNATRGVICSPDHIFISRGSQMAIYLIFKTLITPGDVVVVGETNYEAADWVISESGATMRRIPVDEQGISTDAIEELCRKQAIRAIYITSHHHYPTTVTLSAERRIKLLSLAEEYKFAIVEDDYDYDFHYTSGPILPLASLDTKGHVIYTGSFSKLLAPTVRVGYVVAPPNMITEMAKARRIVDRQGDPILERAVGELISEGEMRRHLKKAVRVYKARRDAFCDLLKLYLGDKVDFKIPDGGMALWARFDNSINLERVATKLPHYGLYLNVEKSFVKDMNCSRLGFASLNAQELETVVARFAKAVNELGV
ncbi:MAG: PLP-dependent aminotransferase family protein [Bacteroidota bacterium]